jgi:hypothetical protein
MTKDKARKRDVRSRAARTGDSYTRARRHEDLEAAAAQTAEGLATARATAAATAGRLPRRTTRRPRTGPGSRIASPSTTWP